MSALAPSFDQLAGQLERLALRLDDLTARRHRDFLTGLFLAFRTRGLFLDRRFELLDLATDLQLRVLLVKALHHHFKLCHVQCRLVNDGDFLLFRRFTSRVRLL